MIPVSFCDKPESYDVTLSEKIITPITAIGNATTTEHNEL